MAVEFNEIALGCNEILEMIARNNGTYMTVVELFRYIYSVISVKRNEISLYISWK